MKSKLNVKKNPSNLIKVISSYNICSGIKSKQTKKQFAIQYQNLLIFFFFQSSSVPFDQVTFGHSISCALLIDKPNESFKNSKNIWKKYLLPKKKLLKRKEKNITPAKTNAPISQTSSDCLKLAIQTHRIRNK